jgi:ABC-type nitrate/sulfonate/bicarbonate transport system substrate-binding protein
MRAKKFGFLILFLMTAPIVYPALAQEGKKLERIRVATSSRSVTYFPMIAAQHQGFYSRQGLELQLILMRATITTSALLTGDLDFSTTFNRDLGAALSGMPIRLVMSLATAPSHVFVVRPEIRTMEQLRGKTLGVDGPKQIIEVLISKGLEKHGLALHRDVKILSMGGAGSGDRFAALVAGRIDGTLLTPPHSTRAVKQGFQALFVGSDISKMSTAGLSTTTTKMQKEPGTISRTIKATLEGMRFLRSNKSEFIKLLAQEASIKDLETANDLYDDYTKLVADTGIAADDSMMESIAFLKDLLGITRKVSISEVADWSFAQQAAKN